MKKKVEGYFMKIKLINNPIKSKIIMSILNCIRDDDDAKIKYFI